MNRQLNKKRGLLGVAIALLCALACLTFPFAFNSTWSQNTNDADRTLTYTTDKLTWDTSAPTNADGTIKLELFQPNYDDAAVSQDGENLVAPGLSNAKTVAIANKSTSSIRYYATAYRTDGTPAKVEPVLSGGEATSEHIYPDGKSDATVLFPVTHTGLVAANDTANVGVGWQWVYDEGRYQDAIDTYLGDKGTDEVTYGLFVVTEEVQTATVSFNTNGGSAVDDQLVEVGTTATKPSPDPTRDGYTFAGWYSDEALTTPFDFTTPIEADTTLYAKWVENPVYHTVTFNSNGGSAVEAQSVVDGELATKPAPDPTREGYTFGGWYIDEATLVPFNFSTPIVADVTLYAKWTEVAATYTVTFNSNGGSAVPSQEVKAGEKATKPENPTREGYTFVAWFADEALKTPYLFVTPVNEDITLYAMWVEDGLPIPNIDNNTNNSNNSSSFGGFDWGLSSGKSKSSTASSAKASGKTIPTTGDGLSAQMLVVFALAVAMLCVVVAAAVRDARKKRKGDAGAGVHEA